MAELNMYPTRSFVRIKATYTNRIPSGGVSYAPFRHFVLLKKYIVYGQGPIACDSSLKYSYILANMPDKQKSINSNNPDALLKVLVMCNLTKF